MNKKRPLSIDPSGQPPSKIARSSDLANDDPRLPSATATLTESASSHKSGENQATAVGAVAPESYATFSTVSYELPAPYHTQEVAKLFKQHPAKILIDTRDARSNQHIESFKGPSGPKLPPLPRLSPGPMAHATFTHPSVTDSKMALTEHATSALDYERLEFLGDAYLEVFCTRLIFLRFQHLVVGKQNRLREELVRNRTLAEFSRRYNFRAQLRFEPGLIERGAAGTWEKILADVFEAYVAAVVLDDPVNGFATAEAWMIALWAPLIEDIEQGRSDLDLVENAKNFKEILNSQIGSAKGVAINYEQIGEMWYTKDRSTQQYRIGCYVTGWGYEKALVGVGVGQSKREAGSHAAEQALKSDPNVRIMKTRKQQSVLERRRRQQEEGQSICSEWQEFDRKSIKVEESMPKPSPLRKL